MSSQAHPAEELKRASSQAFRSTVGNFCSGVTVVTAMGPGGPVGFTCQAFSSLSLQPPRILLCVGRVSRTWPVISGLGAFCVSVLAGDQRALSERFAQSGGDKFQDVRWEPSPYGSPLLTGAAAWFDCGRHVEYDAGDHVIVAGDVRWFDAAPGRPPLLYYRGRYTHVAADAVGRTA